MSVLSHMKSMQKEMSAAEKKIYQFIRDNSEKASGMTANEIAEASGASAPTVVRFSKKMGYNSLTDFKIELSAETMQERSNNTYSDVGHDESFHSLKNKLASNARFTIDETTALFNEEVFLEACKLLEEKEFCYVLGIGASSLACLLYTSDAAEEVGCV
ncbi:MurR/RpiR family transcriptional regulator, partial [Enterococcus sp. S181_ASV_20]|nr:MurR/RpiR family transcriptional regulator [Enterococcus sp. S181_ASV_20]